MGIVGVNFGLFNNTIVRIVIEIFLILTIVLAFYALRGVIRAQNAAEEEKKRREVTQIVKCMMNCGVYYESTQSEIPLYDGEKPNYSFDSDGAVKDLIADCKSLKETLWIRDLEKKREEYLQKRGN